MQAETLHARALLPNPRLHILDLDAIADGLVADELTIEYTRLIDIETSGEFRARVPALSRVS